MILGILAAALQLAVLVAIVVGAVRYLTGRRGGPGDGHGVRRFFQYLILLGLLVVVAVGISELMGLAVSGRPLGDAPTAVARALTFTLVGAPLFVVVALWTRRLMRSDPGEVRSLGWAAYLTVAGLVAAVVAATAVYSLGYEALADGRLDAAALARLVVWGTLWALLRGFEERTLDHERRSLHWLIGTLIGWGTSLVGLTAVLSVSLEALLVPGPDLVLGGGVDLAAAVAVVAAGVPLWFAYWIRGLARRPGTVLWLGHVLVMGVGASLVTTLAGASVVLYRVLVWFLGDAAGGLDRFVGDSVPAVAAATVGALSWWYHRAVLGQRVPGERTEVTRLYEYLLAAVALLAAATGVALLVVAFLRAVVPPGEQLLAASVVNAVLAAVTLLVVGGPLWLLFWRRIERSTAAQPVAEASSPTRRIYLVLLFGVAGVVAVIVLLVLAFMVINDALQGRLGAATIRSAAVPLGLIVAAGAVSGFHWLVFRADRARVPRAAARVGPREVLLVGPRDDALVDQVRRATRARVEVWQAPGGGWPVPEVLALLARVTHAQALILLEPGGPRLIEAGPGSVVAQPGLAPPPPPPPPPPSGRPLPTQRDDDAQGGPGRGGVMRA